MGAEGDPVRMTSGADLPLTIRPAYPDDAPAVRRLAALDSAPVPRGELLLAEIDGELRVAVSLHDLAVIADPFSRTADMVALLRAHAARQTAEPARRGRWLRRPSLRLA